MAAHIELGDRVYVNTSRLASEVPAPGALYATSVVERADRSVRVNLPGGEVSEWISTKFVHHQAGIAIIQLGDYLNEATNLDPLSKGILQNARILYGDDSSVRYWKIRSKSELRYLFSSNFLGFADKIILIGHGDDEGELSIGSSGISAARLGKAISASEQGPASGWQLLCAICHSGRASFGKTLSTYRNVNCVIGPMHESHSSEMSQFIQTYLNWHLLDGMTTTVAAKYARHSATGNATFRMWKSGRRQSLTYD